MNYCFLLLRGRPPVYTCIYIYIHICICIYVHWCWTVVFTGGNQRVKFQHMGEHTLGPVDPAQLRSARPNPANVWPGSARSGLARPGPAWLGPARLGLARARPGLDRSGPVRAGRQERLHTHPVAGTVPNRCNHMYIYIYIWLDAAGTCCLSLTFPLGPRGGNFWGFFEGWAPTGLAQVCPARLGSAQFELNISLSAPMLEDMSVRVPRDLLLACIIWAWTQRDAF